MMHDMAHVPTLAIAYLQILHDVLERIIIVVPSGGLYVKHGVVEVSELIDLCLERILNAEQSLGDLNGRRRNSAVVMSCRIVTVVWLC